MTDRKYQWLLILQQGRLNPSQMDFTKDFNWNIKNKLDLDREGE